MRILGFILLSAMLSACSPVMEATRPDPVDLSQFVVGESHVQVVEQLGAPIGFSMALAVRWT